MENISRKLSDEELLRLALAGDGDAFDLLYERLQSGIYRFTLRMTGSEVMAEDITQDVFITLLRDGGQQDAARGTVRSWLFGVARHTIYRRMKRERFLVPMTEEEGEEMIVDERLVAREDPLAALTRDEMIEAVRQAILSLPPHYREVVLLCHLHEISYAETAQVIGCSVGTVRSRLHRARALLGEKLQAYGKSEDDSRDLLRARCSA
ncbi:MAG: RNA polymerase sigma factor [Blastocatellia bacterium]